MDETLEQFAERMQKGRGRPIYSKEEFDELMEIIEQCKKIKDTITYFELKMIYYLRNGRKGELFLFYMAAMRSYQSNLTITRAMNGENKNR